MPDFLSKLTARPVKLETPGFKDAVLFLGPGASGLEVVVANSAQIPRLESLRSTWKKRRAGRVAPLLLVIRYGDKVALCGPSGEDSPALLGLDPGQVERICYEALGEPDRHVAHRSLRVSLRAIESQLPGIRNEGFLATHELVYGARRRPEWEEASKRSKQLLSKQGSHLLEGLGFSITPFDRTTSILENPRRKLALAVLLEREEAPELHEERFSGLTPIAHALAVADRENLPYVVLLQGSRIRLYPTAVGKGVGRRGRTDTYIECHTGLLRDDDSAFLWLLYSADALDENGTLDLLLEDSQRFAGNLAEDLRDRIYTKVVPLLAKGLAAARRLEKPTAQELSETYSMAMILLFRLLFIAYAEDMDLLPFRFNGLYAKRSLTTKAREIQQLTQANHQFDEGDSLWNEIKALFKAVDQGNREWGVPAYNGGLFSTEEVAAQILNEISLPNTVLGPAMGDLLLVETLEGLGPVDFRSLGVREFGTIYEGLLESELSVADTDLVADPQTGAWRPCKETEIPDANKGSIYLHNRSGSRKSTGSYFTKSFAVEHLLDKALEPAISDHLERLAALDETDAADSFFDFRVADIAMGSGHFLVAAVDRIERAFARALAERPLPGVFEELARLRVAAQEALGDLAEQVAIEDTQLLRRLIARRCIYGVDLNPIAVQLARLAIWIHTFVPGLPLSLLDHNLVHGNSLVGIGTLEEIREKLKADDTLPLFPIDLEHLIGQAAQPLRRLANIADATIKEVHEAERARREAWTTLAPCSALCDIVAAGRIEKRPMNVNLDQWDLFKGAVVKSKEHVRALKVLNGLSPLHFPIVFPEVFLRKRAGFDVILGNPPWEEATVEEHAFWARHFPGLRAFTSRDRESRIKELQQERPDLVETLEKETADALGMRKALISGNFPGMGTGDPDVYKAFCWRFWHLVARAGGRVGVVLPRSALAAAGSAPFRLEVFQGSKEVDVTMLLNNRRWVFEEVHPQYTIGLVSLEKTGEATTASLFLRGPYSSLERFQMAQSGRPVIFPMNEVLQWTDTASLPLLPSEESVEVFAQIRTAPRLDLNDGESWRARPQTELHATNEKDLMDLESLECPEGFWPVFKGASFDIWSQDRGVYYGWADPEIIMLPHLQNKRRRGNRNRRSPFSEFPSEWALDEERLPCLLPRIAFRDTSRATDTRTVRVALVPPRVFLANQAPYFLFPRGTLVDEAFLLGVLSSIPLDWYARRFVETHLNFFVLNPFPVPRPKNSHPLSERVSTIAGRLASIDERFADWAEHVGVVVGSLPDDEKDDMMHELDAVVAHLYGLNQKQLVHIFETFHEGWDYEERLRNTLNYFDQWKNRL